jgi:hypothetical protein
MTIFVADKQFKNNKNKNDNQSKKYSTINNFYQ